MGQTSMGATRWINLGVFNLQPSEVIKVAMILLLARLLAKTANPAGFGLFDLWKPALYVLIPVVLILKQPDLGTASMVVFIAGSMLLFAGLRQGTVIALGIIGVLVAIAGWFGLHDYQRARIMTFLNPEADPLGSGYHIIQSKIAVGSGGLFGKGFVQGPSLSCLFCLNAIPILLFLSLLRSGVQRLCSFVMSLFVSRHLGHLYCTQS